MGKKKRSKRKSKKKYPITPVVGIIVTAIIGIIGIIVVIIPYPIFNIESPDHLRSDQGITVIAGNWKADQEEDLYVIFDGFRLPGPCKPIEKVNNSRQRWKFYLKEHTANPDLLKPGKHSICFAFQGGKSSEVQNIYFIPVKKIITPKTKPIKRRSNAAPVILILLLVIIGIVFFVIIVMRKPGRKEEDEKKKKPGGDQIKRPKIRTPR